MDKQNLILKTSGFRPCDAPKIEAYSIPEIYGENVFDESSMRKYLPYAACKKLKTIMKEGGKIDEQLAEEVAHGVKEWAVNKGVTHYTHWFQPMTGKTAEKHDSFLDFDKEGYPLARFSGKNLSQGEPDASSFPSGGIRSTFEARGYTAWDPTSPIFIMENTGGSTVCIPTVFLSYTGEALDKKTPLLRSTEVLSRAAVRLLKVFGNDSIRWVHASVGAEQEYFLIDKANYFASPDLVLTGRTLFGASSPKDQQLDDHYFGSVKDRVLTYMQDVEKDLYKLGIPAKTRHNEVSPAQFEIAAIYEECNIATDHNQIIMDIMKKIADNHNLAFLVHEKPFAGVNGSGKHNNWSMSTSDGQNLLDPGYTPSENLQFITVLTAVIKAVYKYSDALRATVATIGNDHRLGANEAPPAIISVFLGDQLEGILNDIENNKKTEYTDKQIIELGICKLPIISKDSTDRNRTSPFAFTGNKFEFRAVGSAQSISPANYTINTAVATILNEFSNAIEANLKSGMDLNKAVMEVIIPAIKESKDIRFMGNNYSQEWADEAAKRCLPNEKTTPGALKAMLTEKNIKLFTDTKVFTKREIEARYEIGIEQYAGLADIEAKTAITMAKTIILPAVLRYQKVIADSIASLKAVDESLAKPQMEILSTYAGLVSGLQAKIKDLEAVLKKAAAIGEADKQATAYCNMVLPSMLALREVADLLEELSEDDFWPLPKYREMLFIY